MEGSTMIDIYWVKIGDDGERERVTKEQWAAAERAAGFHNIMGRPNEPATGGFSSIKADRSVYGRITSDETPPKNYGWEPAL